MELALSIIALVLSLFSIIVTYLTWKSDRKNEWYWNIVLNPISEQIKKLSNINDDIKQNEKLEDKQKRATEIERIFRIIKKTVSFLEISYSSKKVNIIQKFIEDQQNEIVSKMFEANENYLEKINSFEIGLYSKICNLVLHKKLKDN